MFPQPGKPLLSSSRRYREQLTTILVLALGIGITVTVFSVVYAVLLEALPFSDPERLVMIWSSSRALRVDQSQVSGGNLEYWKSHSRSFEGMAAFRTYEGYFRTAEGFEHRRVGEISPELLPLLGVRVALGRNFAESDQRRGSPRVAILSYACWKERFGGAGSVIGQRIQQTTSDLTIIGVMPSTFRFFSLVFREEPEMYFPIETNVAWRAHNNRVYRAIGRLRGDSTLEQASSELRVIASALEQEDPRFNAGYSVHLTALRTDIVGRWRTALWIIFATAGSLLLVSSANASVLTLLRSARTRKETALRSALGATPMRLYAELLSEAIMMGLVSGGLGCLAAFVVLRAVGSSELVGELGVPRMSEVGLNPAVLGFAVFTTVVTTVLSILIPALGTAKGDVVQILKGDDRRMSLSGFALRSTRFLVLTQVLFSVVLLDCSFFMLRDLRRLHNLPLGYDYRDVLTVRVAPLLPLNWAAFWQPLIENVRRLPAVESVATTYPLPCQEYPLWDFKLAEGSLPVGQVQQLARFQDVTTNYFQVMKVSLVRGRLFSESSGFWEPGTMVINRAMSQRFWGNQSPLGQRIILRGQPKPYTIVGVVEDAGESPFQATPTPNGYISWPENWGYLLVRTKAPLRSATPMIVSTVRSSAKGIPVDDVRTLESRVFAPAAQPRVQTMLAATFAVLALLLALVGLYATMSFLAATRIKEFGIRVALGATKGDVLSLLVFRDLRVALIGATLGTAGALALTRVLSTLLYGVGAVDLSSLILVPVAVTVLCVTASYIAARRATVCIDAAELLRSQ
jgi:putative ABC transport system permease protein